MKSKIPKKYKKFNKIHITELIIYVKEHYNYVLVYENMYYWVYNYYSKCILKCDSPDMVIYWLDLFKK